MAAHSPTPRRKHAKRNGEESKTPTGRLSARSSPPCRACYGHHARRRAARQTRASPTTPRGLDAGGPAGQWLGCTALQRHESPRPHAHTHPFQSIYLHPSAGVRSHQTIIIISRHRTPCGVPTVFVFEASPLYRATLLSLPRRSPPLLHETDSRQRSSPAQAPEPSAGEARAPAPSPSRGSSEAQSWYHFGVFPTEQLRSTIALICSA